MRIGQGLDAHRLVNDRPLILGGVEIPYTQGLDGHSDADVLLHALCDALLGAAALGDLGQHFPSSDEQISNISSRILLRDVVGLLQQAGWQMGNADCTIIAERPRLAAHIPSMREQVAADCGVLVEQVSIKATTTDKLGFTGRGEGIAASAIVLIEKVDI